MSADEQAIASARRSREALAAVAAVLAERHHPDAAGTCPLCRVLAVAEAALHSD